MLDSGFFWEAIGMSKPSCFKSFNQFPFSYSDITNRKSFLSILYSGKNKDISLKMKLKDSENINYVCI